MHEVRFSKLFFYSKLIFSTVSLKNYLYLSKCVSVYIFPYIIQDMTFLGTLIFDREIIILTILFSILWPNKQSLRFEYWFTFYIDIFSY